MLNIGKKGILIGGDEEGSGGGRGKCGRGDMLDRGDSGACRGCSSRNGFGARGGVDGRRLDDVARLVWGR